MRCSDCIHKKNPNECILVVKKEQYPQIDLQSCGNHKRCVRCCYKGVIGCEYEGKHCIKDPSITLTQNINANFNLIYDH